MATRMKKKVIDPVLSESDADNIHVRMSTTFRSKRKTDDLLRGVENEDIVFERPRKKSKIASQEKLSFTPQQPPNSNPISKYFKKPAYVHPGTALHEHNAKRFKTQAKKPTAWVQLPFYSAEFRAQFSTALRPSLLACSRDARHGTRTPTGAAQAETVSSARPKRQSTLTSYSFSNALDLESEDEIVVSSKTATKRRAPKPPDAADSDSDDDFTMTDGHLSAYESDSDTLVSEDGSSVDPVDVSDESDAPRSKAKPKSSKFPSQTTSRPAARSGAQKVDNENMPSMRRRRGSQPKGLDTSLPPISETNEIFEDLTQRALDNGLDDALAELDGRTIRVATMCSGTESPLLALQMIDEALRKLSMPDKLQVQHLFSAEIVPYKQAYIERNFAPPIIFRDITELTNAVEEATPMATTAYGGKVPIPQNIDILIAGTSCVDFSMLNSRRKGLQDSGESADTWHAVLAYCKAFRPSIVLLENVLNADWATMLSDYESIGYQCCRELVDTKDYYIPQTRQRGYMACFDASKLAGARVADATSTWQDLMANKLKRFASAPAYSFLLPNDQVSRQHLRSDEPLSEYDWTQCQVRHISYRESKGLGLSRPITKWSESGSLQVLDFCHAAYFRKQVERVRDVYDMSALRKMLPSNGMYDISYKSRLPDFSQNIDREEDKRAFGIVGCLTPSGLFFATDAGRALAPAELLRLQGIPLDKISFTTETAAQIQDLAGNAMSSPVIGTSILAALISGHKILGSNVVGMQGPNPAKIVVPTNVPEHQESTTVSSSELGALDMADLRARAELSMRRCYCEEARGQSTQPIQRCASCGHTTCIACGGNPEHDYRADAVLSNARLSPSTFEQDLKAEIPLRLQFRIKTACSKSSSAYCRIVESAFRAIYEFQRMRRTSCWTVLYSSEDSRFQLTLVLGQGEPQWHLYATAPSTLAATHPLRLKLADPIAQGIAVKSFFGTQWQARSETPHLRAVTITGFGAQIASLWLRNQMPDFAEHFVSEYLDVKFNDDQDSLAEQLGGRYQYLPKCGTALSGLFRKIDIEADYPVFLFLDPERVGDPGQDCFVFSRDVTRKEFDERRHVIARVAPGWRPWSTSKENGKWTKPSTKTSLSAVNWELLDGALTSAKYQLTIRKPANIAQLVQSSDCSHAAMILSSDAPGADISMPLTPRAWLFEALRRELPWDDWTPFHHELVNSDCQNCVPQRPALRWGLSETGEIVPYEDPESAAKYERAIKSRPKAFSVALTSKRVDLAVNIASLAERASARLQSSSISKMVYSWRLVGGGKEQQQAFKPRSFQLQPTTAIEPYNFTGMSVRLFPKQQLALAWMRSQEKGVRFVLEQIEEDTISSIGWRAEVKAQAEIEVRGGICADHPGFGKTITSLALIHSQMLEMNHSGIIADLATRQQSIAPGLIPLAATLVVCPATLLKQWVEEAGDKLGYKIGTDIITVRTLADLSKWTFANFRSARIIFVNRTILANETYTERLASFAAIPGPATKSGRSFAQWLSFATAQIPDHLERLERQTSADFKRHIESTYRANVDSERFNRVIPSRRLRGAGYIASKKKDSTATVSLKAPTSVDTTYVRTPLFEQFFFNRIIVDEFHQYEPKESAAIAALKSDKRWGLSGTPALGDFYDVAQIGALLGVPLRVGSDAKGVMKAKNARELKKDMTSFELFDMMRQVPSDATYANIHNHDQQFLDTFVRQNIMDFDDIVFHEHLLPVTLELDHYASYFDLSQKLNTTDMRLRKAGKGKAKAEGAFAAVVEVSETAEEALSRFAAAFETSSRGTEKHLRREADQILSQLPNAVADARKNQPEKFKQFAMLQLDKGALGDAATIAKIQKIVQGSAKVATGHKELKKGETATLNKMCKRLVVLERSLRYLRNTYALQKASLSGKAVSACDFPGCEQDATISPDVAVSASCGHFVCRACYDNLQHKNKTTCEVEGCDCSMHDSQLLWTNKLTKLGQPHATSFGAKIEAAVQLLYRIQKQGDQAILFVQYPSQLRDVDSALRGAKIPAIVVEDTPNAGALIAEFRNSNGEEAQETVIVLNASSETAAGSNLQCANHVIFLSPLLRDSQYGYDSTMAQAIGRVRRHGQKKEIHVYRIVALDTIDVDILEHRERRSEAMTEQGARTTQPPPAARRLSMHGQPKPERTQLVCENGRFSLRPRSWLVKCGADEEDSGEGAKVMGRNRVLGWEDFSSLIKFSNTFTENDE